MHNPLRSEADALRWFVVVCSARSRWSSLTVLTRPLVGVIWAAVLIGFGPAPSPTATRAGRIARGRAELTRGGDGRHRLLVVANETVGRRGAAGGDRQPLRAGATARSSSITPALAASRADHWASDIDEAIVLARQRMELSVIEIEQRLGLQGAGGDRRLRPERRDRRRAARLPRRRDRDLDPPAAASSRWLERGVVDRAREEIDLPITHVVVDLEAEGAARPAANG